MNPTDIVPVASMANAPLQAGPAHRILVVDDDQDIRHLNSRVLLRSGYHVDAASDGAAAWDALNAGRYDLLITDHNMPKVSGVELFKKLRAARMPLPVIMATGAFPHDEFSRSPELQLAATLIKPYTAAQLLGTVQEVLRATLEAVSPAPPTANGHSSASSDGLPHLGPLS